MKRGQEADSLIKMDPQYVVTPSSGGVNNASQRISQPKIKQVVMEAIQEVKGGAGNSIQYLPFSATAHKMFAEPRRTITTKEILSEEALTVSPLGVDDSILAGGVGAVNDPMILAVFSEIFGFYSSQMEAFVKEKLLKMLEASSEEFSLGKEVRSVYVQRIDQAPGTLVDSKYYELAAQGSVPMSPILNRFGFSDKSTAVSKKFDEDNEVLRVQLQKEEEAEEILSKTQLRDQARKDMSPQAEQRISRLLEEKAEMMAQQMSQMEEGLKRSHMDKLQKENYALAAVVSQKLEDINQMQTARAKNMVKTQQPRGGSGV